MKICKERKKILRKKQEKHAETSNSCLSNSQKEKISVAFKIFHFFFFLGQWTAYTLVCVKWDSSSDTSTFNITSCCCVLEDKLAEMGACFCLSIHLSTHFSRFEIAAVFTLHLEMNIKPGSLLHENRPQWKHVLASNQHTTYMCVGYN